MDIWNGRYVMAGVMEVDGVSVTHNVIIITQHKGGMCKHQDLVHNSGSARLKWEMEWALRTFIEKLSWRQPHYRTQDESPNPDPNPNADGRSNKHSGVILL